MEVGVPMVLDTTSALNSKAVEGKERPCTKTECGDDDDVGPQGELWVCPHELCLQRHTHLAETEQLIRSAYKLYEYTCLLSRRALVLNCV